MILDTGHGVHIAGVFIVMTVKTEVFQVVALRGMFAGVWVFLWGLGVTTEFWVWVVLVSFRLVLELGLGF